MGGIFLFIELLKRNCELLRPNKKKLYAQKKVGVVMQTPMQTP